MTEEELKKYGFEKVIHCKDCKWYNPHNNWCWEAVHTKGAIRSEESFCSWAEEAEK